MRGKLLRQPEMCSITFGDDEKPGRVLVEAMHNARTLDPAYSRQTVAAVGDECIDEGACRMARAGMHGQTRRLVDHNEMCVFVHDGEGDFLRL